MAIARVLRLVRWAVGRRLHPSSDPAALRPCREMRRV